MLMGGGGGLGFRLGKVENVGVEGIAMGRRLLGRVTGYFRLIGYIGQIRRLEKNIRLVTHVF